MADETGSYNPFAKRTGYGRRAIIAYRTLTPLSWLLVVIFGIYYSVRRPGDVSNGETISEQTDLNPTPFSQTTVITVIYWVVLLLSQLVYMGQLWSADGVKVTTAANVAPYYILNNLFLFAFTHLWVRSHFWGAEVINIASLLNQGTVYWNHPGLPALIHLPAVAGPYAWSLSTLFWNGAVAVGGESTAKRVVANIFIWVYFLVGQSHITHRGDQEFGYSISALTLSLALKQFSIKIISLQWIFAFVIFGVFLVSSFHASATKYYNRDFYFRNLAEPEPTDRERQPLLSDE